MGLKYIFRFLRRSFFLSFVSISLFTGCSVSKHYLPSKKFAREQLQEDFSLLKNILEKKHPSLYWYTSKDSMDFYFKNAYESIEDSMTELQFGWKIIAPLTNKIHCGHTSFSMSNRWSKFIRNRTLPSFPLHLKVWADTMIVTGNLHLHKDSAIKKGALITAINGIPNHELLQNMFSYLPQDGYADNVNNIRLSMNFPYFHRNIFGLYDTYSIKYIDGSGIEENTFMPYYKPPPDSLVKNKERSKKIEKRTRQQKLQRIRWFKSDTSGDLAIMKLNSFSKGHLQKFFRRSFKKIKDTHAQNLVIDIRSNGGGDINNFVSLTRYVRNSPFKVADTAAAIAKNFRPYSKYIKTNFLYKPALIFLTRKRSDGRYHFGYWEKRIIRPKQRNHFDGNVYVLINGLTFSASALFCNSVKGQSNVLLIGEETGGGWYGNSGIMIPDIILPNTKLKVRLPFFRLVQYDHIATKGTGISPDILVNPTVKDIRNNTDGKMEMVKELILKSKMSN